MKQDRLSLSAGFLPGAALLIWLACQRYLLDGSVLPPAWSSASRQVWIWIGSEAAMFLIPFALLMLMRGRKNRERVNLRVRRLPKGAVPTVLTLALAMALLNVLLGDFFAGLSGRTYFDLQPFFPLMERGASGGVLLLAVVVLPAVGGTLLYHGGLVSVYESCGALPALAVSAAGFALLTGAVEMLPGAFLAAFAFGYLTLSLDSLWAAMLGQSVYGAVSLLLLYVTRAYGALELWSVICLVLVFLFAGFLYLSMRSMELLIDRGTLRRLERIKLGKLTGTILMSPGLWMMVLLFIVNIVYA